MVNNIILPALRPGCELPTEKLANTPWTMVGERIPTPTTLRPLLGRSLKYGVVNRLVNLWLADPPEEALPVLSPSSEGELLGLECFCFAASFFFLFVDMYTNKYF